MQLTAPKPITFWIAVVLAVAGGVARLTWFGYWGWLLAAAFAVLALGNLVKRL